MMPTLMIQSNLISDLLSKCTLQYARRVNRQYSFYPTCDHTKTGQRVNESEVTDTTVMEGTYKWRKKNTSNRIDITSENDVGKNKSGLCKRCHPSRLGQVSGNKRSLEESIKHLVSRCLHTIHQDWSIHARYMYYTHHHWQWVCQDIATRLGGYGSGADSGLTSVTSHIHASVKI